EFLSMVLIAQEFLEDFFPSASEQGQVPSSSSSGDHMLQNCLALKKSTTGVVEVIMNKRKAGAFNNECTPLGNCTNIDKNGTRRGMHEVGVAKPGKPAKKPFVRRPLADCTNVLSFDPKKCQVGEEITAKRRFEAERKHQYRARKKAELENSLPTPKRESPVATEADPTTLSTVMNPTLGLGSNTTTPSLYSQRSAPVSNPTADAMTDTVTNPTMGSASIVDPYVDGDDDSWLQRNADWCPAPSYVIQEDVGDELRNVNWWQKRSVGIAHGKGPNWKILCSHQVDRDVP
ncbi:hypothetical protein EJB05_27295, partial [Eragrostis curvula]